MSYYPSYVYSYREDITRENMRAYDRKQEKIYNKCLEICPDYHSKNLRERKAIEEKAETLID